MKACFRLFILVPALLFTVHAFAQQGLPDFSVKELSQGRIQISWINPYPNCTQLAIQRSSDSSKNFRTIFSSLSPELPSNGYVDTKLAAGTKWYYRIFYVLRGGDYFFSNVIAGKIKAAESVTPKPVTPETVITETPLKDVPKEIIKPVMTPRAADKVDLYLKKNILYHFTREEYNRFRDSVNTKTKDALHKLNEHAVEWRPARNKKNNLTAVFRPDSPALFLAKKAYDRFRDSVNRKTKDTLTRMDEWSVLIHPYIPKAKKLLNVFLNGHLATQLDPEAYKNFKDSVSRFTKDTLYVTNNSRIDIHPFIPKPKTFISIYKNDSLLFRMEASLFRKFKDSVSLKTKDSLFMTDNSRADIHVFVPKYVWKPSVYVYTNAQGYVSISLPQVKQHKYHLVFFEENGAELFRIKTLKEPELVLDKTNFMHAGWFYFELFEDDKLKEKNKFQLLKDY